jgi:transposase-like protein
MVLPTLRRVVGRSRFTLSSRPIQLLNEIYLIIDGRMAYLWRAVDAEGEVLNVPVQATVSL